jgi:hypothetical protein
MRSRSQAPGLLSLLVLGAVAVGLLPLRLAARLLGGLLLAVAIIGVPAWLIQLLISLLGGRGGGGPLPAGVMVALLAMAAPAGILLLHVASVPGPFARATHGDGAAVPNAEPDEDDEPEPPHNGQGDWIDRTDRASTLLWAYQTLELDPGASVSEVKAAYRRLAQAYHPDHNPGFTREASERFAEVNAAYETLLHELGTAELRAGETDRSVCPGTR